MGDLEVAEGEIQRTIELLRQCSCDGWADRLEELLTVVRGADRYAQKEALFSVGEVCHPKALGEAIVTAVDWEAQIEKLHDACARAFNSFEKGSI